MLFDRDITNIFDDSETVMPQLMRIMRTDIQEKDGDYLRQRLAGGCQRSFFVGDKVKQEDISAAFKDGILSIIITNRERSVEREERKLIPIK